MSNRPEVFFRDFVQRSYREWLANPCDEYLAKVAVHNANVMAERAWHYFRIEQPDRVFGLVAERQEGEYRNRLAAHECKDFGLVRDADDNFKHLEVKRRNARVRRFDQTGRANGEADEIVIRLNDGSTRALREVMKNVIDMWERLLRGSGLLP